MARLTPLLISLLWPVASGLSVDARPAPRALSNTTASNQALEVSQFAIGTWVENIAVRSNGKLLITMTTPPELWEIDPFQSPEANATKLVRYFDGVERATGIIEVKPNVFMVAADSSIWQVDFRNQRHISVSEVVNITTALLLNGPITLDASTVTILAADSQLGLICRRYLVTIWRINTRTTDYEMSLQGNTMAPSDDLGLPLGVNGVRVWKDYVYYNNTARPYEIITQGALSDDFAVAPDGTAYLPGLTDNVVTRAQLNGTREVVAGSLNSTAGHYNTLYVTTSGGGKVMAIML
ncbi:hypothetical protein K469DRAFT_727076 [Zopfia rhizophila CBS 207.26]|uniref:Calcium-dependent phosphotriesterase n=1 Tax=Zopfia rhizophila CBS 207.26 TaxID=1314779 RepID=A0A6A6E2V2_9PEZI|nr:hypothetical protein K469DRAFT_727076 [Zopfia rhizophila CBS 207.26]